MYVLFLEREEMYGDDANDASNRLSHKKMIDIMNKTHPRKQTTNEEGYTEYQKHLVCKTKTGCHDCCSRERRRSELEQYGVGSVLYFQFLKYMGMMFCINFCLAIPAIIFYFQGNELPSASLSKIVTAASLGNLGTASPTCYESRFDLITENANLFNPTATFTLRCPFGDLYSIAKFGQVSVNDNVDCE